MYTYVGAKCNLDPGQFGEPVPPSARGVQYVVIAHVHDAIDVFVEYQPGAVWAKIT